MGLLTVPIINIFIHTARGPTLDVRIWRLRGLKSSVDFVIIVCLYLYPSIVPHDHDYISQENDPPTYYLYYMSIVYVFNPMCAVGLP